MQLRNIHKNKPLKKAKLSECTFELNTAGSTQNKPVYFAILPNLSYMLTAFITDHLFKKQEMSSHVKGLKLVASSVVMSSFHEERGTDLSVRLPEIVTIWEIAK